MALDPLIEKLLVLQDRDVRRDEISRRLEDIPSSIADLERKIQAEQGELEKMREQHRSLELKRRELEHSAEEADEQRARFRTQQLSVKKNEEYTALEHQINGVGVQIDQLETETIEVLLLLDESEAAIAAQKLLTDAEVEKQRGNIVALERVCASLKGDFDGAVAQAEEAQAAVPEDFLATYQYVKRRVKRPPYVVLVEDQHCMGCHLKVSHDVLKQASEKGSLTRCDSCGRIVYMDR